MFSLTPSLSFISPSGKKIRLWIGCKEQLKNAARPTSILSRSILISTRCAATRALKRSWKKLPAQNHEGQFLFRAEAAQRLQGCRRLRGRWLVAGPGHDTGFPIFRNPELGSRDGRGRAGDRVSHCAGSFLGV